MSTIEKVEAWLIDVPTTRPHVLAMATMRKQSIVLVRLHCADGFIGLGEATTIGGLSYGPESPESIKLTIERYLTPLLVGQDSNAVAACMQHLRKSVVDNHFAKCAIETALLDALGQRLGVPISQLLGGRVRDRVSVAWVLASGQLDQDIGEAEQMIVDRRHNIFKVKIGKRDLADDVAHVGAIKKALGDRGEVRVDVNQAWNRSQAQRGCAMLAEAGIDLVEQPLPKQDIAGAAALVQQGFVPIMADEVLHGPHTAWQVATNAACNVMSLKIAQSGGLYDTLKVAHLADTAGFELYGGTMLESAIGTVASAHVCATVPQLPWGTELFAPLLLAEELLTEPLVYSDFQLTVPDQPGLGVTLDEEKVRFFKRDA